MRDRETDSWWSIMTSTAIGGEMEGAELVELPISEKSTWSDWVRRYPDTLVLSIDGEEHVAENRYDKYFASEGTFRNIEIADRRLAPKEPIYSFFIGERPYAVAHREFGGGQLFTLPNHFDRQLFVYREKGSPMFASSRAWLVETSALDGAKRPKKILALLESGGAAAAQPVGGIDTFWYNWILINKGTTLLE